MTDDYDPRACLRTGDEEIAYPDHDKERKVRDKIEPALTFVRWLMDQGYRICREEELPQRGYTRRQKELYEEMREYGFASLYQPIAPSGYSPEIHRLVMRWQGVDYDAFDAEWKKAYDFVHERVERHLTEQEQQESK